MGVVPQTLLDVALREGPLRQTREAPLLAQALACSGRQLQRAVLSHASQPIGPVARCDTQMATGAGPRPRPNACAWSLGRPTRRLGRPAHTVPVHAPPARAVGPRWPRYASAGAGREVCQSALIGRALIR